MWVDRNARRRTRLLNRAHREIIIFRKTSARHTDVHVESTERTCSPLRQWRRHVSRPIGLRRTDARIGDDPSPSCVRAYNVYNVHSRSRSPRFQGDGRPEAHTPENVRYTLAKTRRMHWLDENPKNYDKNRCPNTRGKSIKIHPCRLHSVRDHPITF